MLRPIPTGFRDARAVDLSLRLGLGPQPALATLTVPMRAGTLELRLLGHSHQVTVQLGAPDGEDQPVLSEAVACVTGGGQLPRTAERELTGGRYRFESETVRCDAPSLARRAEQLLEEYSEDAAALVGLFPGFPHALTVVVAQEAGPPGSLAWRSWHLYPQTREIVATSSAVDLTIRGTPGHQPSVDLTPRGPRPAPRRGTT